LDKEYSISTSIPDKFNNSIKVRAAVTKEDKILDEYTVIVPKDMTELTQNILFKDTVETKYESAAKVLAGLGIISGYPDGTFKPNNNITRAEFTVIASRFLRDTDEDSFKKNIFNDVDESHWAYEYINKAYSLGIIKGYNDNTFKPDNEISYQEAITILLNVAGFKEEIADTQAQWPYNYITKAIDMEITSDMLISEFAEKAARGKVADITLKTYLNRRDEK
jgi:hypothetical protein